MIPNITMIDSGFDNCTKLEKFLRATREVAFKAGSKKEKYEWARQVFDRVEFRKLGKLDRGIVRRYIKKITGYSTAQITRLVAKYLKSELFVKSYQRHRFPTRFLREDINLLIKTDNVHSRLNGYATKVILQREYLMFGRPEYANIASISVSHIYNLRHEKTYLRNSLTFTHTKATQVSIGERRKPDPKGQPGYIRVDTVHQGDLITEARVEGAKGVYHINSIDQTTQWEMVAAVEKISEAYLEPILKLLIQQYPFRIIEFHADNGSEYINHTVARLLNKLLIKLTKSRSRKTNDNALVEGKNGSIIRKHMGYFYICQKYAPDINDFYVKYFNPYLNFHRPCGFATIKQDQKGKQKKVYDTYLTPYEALKSIVDCQKFLKPGQTLAKLDTIAYEYSDNDFATIMDTEKQRLFEKIGMNPVKI